MNAPGLPQSRQHTWASPPALVGMAWVLCVGALAWTILADDPRGRILTAIAAVGLLLFALFGTVARPRLSADPDGIEIRRLGGRQRWPWGVVRISVSSTRRFGRTVSLLELDTGNDTADDDEDDVGGLVVLGWLDLGTEPEQVAAVLRAYRTGPLR
jgi:Bacterial PH domain